LTDDNRNQLSQSAGCTSLANDCVSELSKDPIVVAAYCKLMKNLSMSGELCEHVHESVCVCVHVYGCVHVYVCVTVCVSVCVIVSYIIHYH